MSCCILPRSFGSATLCGKYGLAKEAYIETNEFPSCRSCWFEARHFEPDYVRRLYGSQVLADLVRDMRSGHEL